MLSTIVALVIALFSLIALMVIHEFGHFIIAKKFGVRVDEFGVGYPPRIFGKKIGETIYSINLIPLGAFVKIYGEEGGVDDYRSFAGLKIWKRILIVLGGVVAFWLAAIVLFSIVFAIGADIPVTDEATGLDNVVVKVFMVSKNSPADLSGLQTGDVISNIKTQDSNTKIDKITDFQKVTGENKGKEITLVIQRQGKELDISLTPRVSPPQNEGSVGIALERIATVAQRYPFYLAPIKGTTYCFELTMNAIKGFYELFKNLFVGRGLPQGAGFAGPLGITVFLASAVSGGMGFFLYFIGSISVFIAIFNLFPIPALDGGKLIFLIIEKILKKPVPVKVEQNITVACFVILITLSIFITIKFDIPRFTDFLKSSLSR